MFRKVSAHEIIEIANNIRELVHQLLDEIGRLCNCIGFDGEAIGTIIKHEIVPSLRKLDKIVDSITEKSQLYVSSESCVYQSAQSLNDYIIDDIITDDEHTVGIEDIKEKTEEGSDDTAPLSEQIAGDDEIPGLFTTRESVGGEGEQQDRVALRRKALAEALRRGDFTTVAPVGTIQQRTEKGYSNAQTYINHSDGGTAIQVPPGKLAGGIGFCRVCGSPLPSLEALFCPYGGSRVLRDHPRVNLRKVHFSALAPKMLLKGDYSMIDIVMYEEAFRNIVDDMIREREGPIAETKSSPVQVASKSRVRIVIHSPDIDIEDNEDEQEWIGEYLKYSFAVRLPELYSKQQVLFIATVYIEDVISTRLRFIVKCRSLLRQKTKITREDILSAFVSYASQDRNRVAMIIQGMKKVRPDMDIFFDVENLRSGQDWEERLYDEISKRDILYLCWSHFAQESKWVDAEWRYAFTSKGIDSIEPVPIEPPDRCPPPEELKKKHFNDKLLYIIDASR